MDTNPDHLEAQGVELMYNLVSSPEVLSLMCIIHTFHFILPMPFSAGQGSSGSS